MAYIRLGSIHLSRFGSHLSLSPSPPIGTMQKWADQVSDDNYLWENVLPYYKRSPTVTPPDLSKRFPTNSTISENYSSYDNSLNGPLQVSWPNWASPWGTWVLKGLNAVGVPLASSFVSGSILGAGWNVWTLNPATQTRDSSQSSFLNYAVQTSDFNFYIYKNTLAKKILFDSNKTATGVLVSAAGLTYQLNVGRQVIVSAGVFQSPQILMVSGIGPASILSQYDIPILSDLPGVGQNMQDHPAAEIIHRVNVNTASKLINDPSYAAAAGLSYLTHATGPLTASGSTVAWEKIPSRLVSNSTIAKIASLPDDWPEIEFIPADAYMGYNREYEAADPHDGYNYASLLAVLQSPFSRGNVSISSNDMSDPPLINPNWITDPADVDIMIAGIKRAREIAAAIQEVMIGDEVLPGANVTTDERILEFISEALVTVYHAAGTCAMGRASDPMAVVDSHARVFGVNGVRVVDASAFPLLPPGHPQATCYMLAEKIADDIKNGE